MKFYTFLYKNNDAPYHVKKTVWDSALKSAIFYSSETWLTRNLKCAESVYIATLKRLLGVRATTSTDVVLLEAGVPSAKAFIKQKQLTFVRKLLSRDGFWDSYIGKAMTYAMQNNTPAGLILRELIDVIPPHNYTNEQIKQRVIQSELTRHQTYVSLNPTLSVSYAYTAAARIPEFQRIAYTRMRTSSHRLREETGRWTRPPTLLANRTCPCANAIQTERHVLMECSLTSHLRNQCEGISANVDIGELLELNADNAYSIKLYADVLLFFADRSN